MRCNLKLVAEFDPAVNQTDVADKSIQPSVPGTNRRRVGLLVLVLVFVGGIWSLVPKSALPPEVTILPLNYSIRSLELPLPDRWIPPTWGWLWRLRYALLGSPATIQIEGKFVRLASSSDLRLADALSGHAPLAASNGVCAWILPDDKLRALRQRLERVEGYEAIASPRITSGHGVQANLAQTTTVSIEGAPSPVGVFFNCLTCARDKTTDLTAAITHSEAVADSATTVAAAVLGNSFRVHTNLTLAAKLQIPPGNGAFLLDTNHADPHGKCVGVFISSKVE